MSRVAVGPLQALLWDVDGTLAETERDGHRVAFNRAFEACGLPWHWSIERYRELLAVAGGRERLLHDMAARADAPATDARRDELARRIHRCKNAIYGELVAQGGIPLRPGVRELMHECRDRGVRMAIVTTTSRSNVQALLRAQLGVAWAQWFESMVCGEDVSAKKPHPQAYIEALRRLGLVPRQALAIEDSPGGAAAARAAGVAVVVTRSVCFADSKIDVAAAIGPGFDQRLGWCPRPAPGAAGQRIGLDDLVAWHQRVWRASQLA